MQQRAVAREFDQLLQYLLVTVGYLLAEHAVIIRIRVEEIEGHVSGNAMFPAGAARTHTCQTLQIGRRAP